MEFSNNTTKESQNPDESERLNQSGNKTPPRRIGACIEEPLDTYLHSNQNLAWQVNQNYGENKKEDVSMDSITGSNIAVASGVVDTSYDADNYTNFVVQTRSKKYLEADHKHHAKDKYHKHHAKDKYADHRWADLKNHLDTSLAESRKQSRRELEELLIVVLRKSTALNGVEERLHKQLLRQSETMVAMKLKLLQLEAKIDQQVSAHRNRQSPVIEEIPRQRPPRSISSTATLASGDTQPSLQYNGYDDDVSEQTVESNASGNTVFESQSSECKLGTHSPA